MNNILSILEYLYFFTNKIKEFTTAGNLTITEKQLNGTILWFFLMGYSNLPFDQMYQFLVYFFYKILSILVF